MKTVDEKAISEFLASWHAAHGESPQPLSAVSGLAPAELTAGTTGHGATRRLGMVLQPILGKDVSGLVLQRVTGPVSGSVTHYQVRQIPCGAGTALDAPTGKENRR